MLSLVAMFLCALGLPVLQAPRAAAQAARLVEGSAYYIAELEGAVKVFPIDEYGGRSFRVFGIDEDVEAPMKGLNRAQAKQQCVSVGGLGLARALNTQRKEALDAAMTAAERAKPQADKDVMWVGGFRTSLSEPACKTGAVTHYPYFIEFDASSWSGCGTDPVWDWGWTKPVQGGEADYDYWRDVPESAEYNPALWWDGRDGINDTDSNNPSGFSDTEAFNLTEGFYENCTVARYKGDDDPSGGLDTVEVSWKDWGCRSPLYRWVCEMPDVEGFGSADVGVESAISGGYFIEGVSNEVRTVENGMKVRLFGIVDAEGAIGEGYTALKWSQAEHACLAMGGKALAFDATPKDHEGRNSLLAAAFRTLFDTYGANNFSAWIGGFTGYMPGPGQDPITTSDFMWWEGFGETVPFDEGTRARWASTDFPSMDLALFSPDPSENGEGDGMEGMKSCVYVFADSKSTEATFRHTMCNSTDIQYFMCQFGEDHPDDFAAAEAVVGGLESEGSGSPSSGGTSSGVIVGVAIAVVLVVLVALLCCAFLFIRRKRAAKRHAQKGANDAKDLKHGPPAAGAAAFDDDDVKLPMTPHGLPATPKSTTSQHAPQAGFRSLGTLKLSARNPALLSPSSTVDSDLVKALQVKQTHSRNSYVTMTYTYTTDAALETAASTMSGSAATTDAAELIENLQERLQNYAAKGSSFGGRYRLHSEQRVGGQGVVQFATGLYNGYEYAIKFFLKQQTFEAELVMYQHHVLQQLLPKTADVHDARNQNIVDTECVPFPSFIVMEKGEALDEWSIRAKADVVTAVQVLIHLASRLADLHKAGLVHRDLKPSNVMWLPRENKWTVIDFGCAAVMDSKAPIAFSLPYVGPEVLHNLQAGNREMVVTGALDCWSVGVIAFELLVGERGVDASQQSREEIVDMLSGTGESLPWEGDKLTKDKARKMGFLRKPILQMLSRDPRERPTMAEFKGWLERLFKGATTAEQDTFYTCTEFL